LALCVPWAHADGGRIGFTGAVLEPTCSVGYQRIGIAESSGSQFYHCTERTGATPGQAAQSYTLSVVSVSGTAIASDRLIGYYANYLKAEPKLVTQTYE